MTKTIFVQVPKPKPATKTSPAEEPRTCPIHASDNPNGGALLLTPDDEPIEVVDSATIRRRIRSNDLEVATPKSPSKKEG